MDLFRCKSATWRAPWVLVIMDQYTRRTIGFGVHAGTVDWVALCRMFNRAIRGHRWLPKYLTSDNDPLSLAEIAGNRDMRVRNADERPTNCFEGSCTGLLAVCMMTFLPTH